MKSLALFAGALLGASPAWAATADYAPLPPPPVVNPDAVPMPDIQFAATGPDQKDFDKYFFFHRQQTDFATAYADIRECDQYVRGLPGAGTGLSNAFSTGMMTQFGMAGGVAGSIIGGIIAAEVAAAEQRKLRRRTLMTCMGFKEYRAYGLPKEKWELFNFEETRAPKDEGQRQYYLQMQAKAASGPQPSTGQIKP